MLHRDVPAETQVPAVALSFVVGAPLGLGCYALLRPLRRRGRAGRFVAQAWAWWLALAAGLTTAVAVGGPYVVGSRRPVGGGETGTRPLTPSSVLWISTVLALGYPVFGLAARHEASRPGAGRPSARGPADA